MAQFDVYRNPVAARATDMPFLLDVQSDLLAGLATRVFAPLIRLDVMPGRPAAILNPVLTVDGESCLLLTQEMAGIPLKRFKHPVANLAAERETILRALNFVIAGI